MTDARWIEIFDDFGWSVEHFSRAVQIHDAGGFEGESLEAYKSRMALLQAMQSGHTLLESGLIRVLEMLGEEPPVGDSFHADLIRRVRRDVPGARPAIVSGGLADAIDETRRFRHVARKNYNDFRPAEAKRAISAAAVVRDGMLAALSAFRVVVDPTKDAEPDGGDGSGGSVSGGPR